MPKETYISELVEYLKKNLKKGYTQESLKWALISQGHSKASIEKAIKVANEEFAKEAPILETKPVIKYEIIGPNIPVEEKPFWKRLFGL